MVVNTGELLEIVRNMNCEEVTDSSLDWKVNRTLKSILSSTGSTWRDFSFYVQVGLFINDQMLVCLIEIEEIWSY